MLHTEDNYWTKYFYFKIQDNINRKFYIKLYIPLTQLKLSFLQRIKKSHNKRIFILVKWTEKRTWTQWKILTWFLINHENDQSGTIDLLFQVKTLIKNTVDLSQEGFQNRWQNRNGRNNCQFKEGGLEEISKYLLPK